MELRLLVVAALAAAGALLAFSAVAGTEREGAEFTDFVRRFGKTYASPQEAEYRRALFEQRLQKIRAHNAKGLSWTRGVNKFSDLTWDEFRRFYLSSKTLDNSGPRSEEPLLVKGKKLDWRTKNAVTPIKDQKDCGSCWAFSSTGAIESLYAIKGVRNADGSLKQFSEQELVDCSRKQGNEGCDGGLQSYAYDYWIPNKLNLEDDYKYTATDQKCAPKKNKPRFGMASYKVLEKFDVNTLIAHTDTQPLPIAIEVQDDFMDYKDGVYVPADKSCGDGLNHGVLLVGYDTTVKQPFFIIKNSWGTSWGKDGYILVAVGTGRGTCGVANSWDVIPKL